MTTYALTQCIKQIKLLNDSFVGSRLSAHLQKMAGKVDLFYFGPSIYRERVTERDIACMW